MRDDIQYLVITYIGKDSEKGYMCIYVYTHIYIDHFAVHMKLTQHRKATIFQLKNNNFLKKLKTNKKAIVTDKI